MNFLFPYEKVTEGSDIILYGLGEVGKQFFWQINSNSYCRIIGWTDKKVRDNYECKSLLIPPKDILNRTWDYVVIAVAAKADAVAIKSFLLNKHIEESKIIWKDNYEIYGGIWSDNEDFFLKNADFMLDLFMRFYRTKQQFGEGGFYQSFPQIGIRGQRPTQERIAAYSLESILNSSMDVLDIGCNCGFLDMQIACKVRSVTGIEKNHELVEIADMVKGYLHIDNCTFLEQDFCSWCDEKKYNMIFAFAILCWLQMETDKIVKLLIKYMKPGGYILLESHNLKSGERLQNFWECVEVLKKNNMTVERTGTICDDGRISRKFVLLHDNMREAMTIFEYDREEHIRMERAEAREEVIAEGCSEFSQTVIY